MIEPTEPKNKTQALARVQTGVCGLVLNNLEDMKTVAQLILQSGLAPDSFKTAAQIFVGLQAGAEIGLKPMQALNSIVVIKGKPTLWGDAALALVKRSGLSEYCKEYFELKGMKISEKDLQYANLIGYPDTLMAVCETKRKGEDEPVIRYFSVADAKLAGLWDKRSKTGGKMPWSTHPKRMLKYKARAFNLRDNFPDVLFGMHLAEEMVGEEPLPAPESDVLPRDERRSLAVPSSTLDGRREPVPADVVSTEMVGTEKKRNLTAETEPAGDEDKKPPTFRGTPLVNESPLSDDAEDKKTEDAPAEPSIFTNDEKGRLKELYIEVNGMYVALNGQDFIEFAAYVLCLDESEVAPSKLTEEQLRQIEAYISTNGINID